MSLPPPPDQAGSTAEPSAELPPLPQNPGPHRGRGWIVILVVAMTAVAGAVGVGVAMSGDDRNATALPSPAGTSAPTDGPSPMEDPSPVEPADVLPDSLGGYDRLAGDEGEAFVELIRASGGDQAREIAVYGTILRPRYLLALLGDSFPGAGFPGRALIDVTVQGMGVDLVGPVVEGTEGSVRAACGEVDHRGLTFVCVMDDRAAVFMLMGFSRAPSDDPLRLAMDAAA